MSEPTLQELTRRIAELEAEKALSTACDDVLEAAVRARLPLAQTIQKMFAVLLRALGAKSAFVRTYDESLEKSDFTADGASFAGDTRAVVEAADRREKYFSAS